jgi:hypothetical protein
MTEDTRIIKLPSRSKGSPAMEATPMPDKYKNLTTAALPVDVELASVIAAWAHLPRNLKDNILTLTCIRH